MRGFNKVVLSGNVGNSIKYDETRTMGVSACTFQLASERHYSSGRAVTVWVKINVYVSELVELCQKNLHRGIYVLVEGELMNRDGPELKELVEVRARDLIFPQKRETNRDG